MNSNEIQPYSKSRIVLFPERIIPLHVMLTSYGQQLVDTKTYRWSGLERGNREFIIWQYTIRGEGGLDINGESHRVRAGEAMLLVVPEDHCYYLPKESNMWEFIWVSLNGKEAVRLVRELRSRINSIYKVGEDSKALKIAQEIVSEKCSVPLDNIWDSSAKGYEFLLQLAAELCCHGKSSSRLNFMRKINDFCMENLDSGITVEDLAQKSGYSKWHFSRIFREYNGVSPMQYIIDLKMRRATQLLQNTKLQIKEIAAMCGFEESGYFCNVFRKTYGVSPQKFRSVDG